MHISVMKNETINLLNIREGGFYIDCTFGEGGHTYEILKKGGVVLAIDRDPKTEIYANNLSKEFGDQFTWVNGSFLNIYNIWNELAYPMKVDGILFDFGFSSNQIDDPERGFSFLYNSNLDMRYNCEEDILTGLDVVNKLSQKELEKIFFEYGQENNSKKIAQLICEARKTQKIETCFDLLNICRKASNLYLSKHFATKIFQAIRIYVNNEFKHIEQGVNDSLKILKYYGRIVTITFHSLEDKIIKNIFQNKNIIECSKEEILKNKRARSAKVRWFINKEVNYG